MEAINSVWFIGDDFINETYHALQQMKAESRVNPSEKPYVYTMYNVRCFTSKPACLVQNIPARIVNCLIKALNEAFSIPRFIVVVPDWDILRFINHFTYGVEILVQESLDWMIDNMKKVIRDKKDQLFKIHNGSVVSTQPKIIWVKMLQRMRSYEKILTVRGKYNSVLKSTLAEESLHYIIDPNPILRDSAYFARDNHLNSDGSILFWKEIDECI